MEEKELLCLGKQKEACNLSFTTSLVKMEFMSYEDLTCALFAFSLLYGLRYMLITHFGTCMVFSCKCTFSNKEL